MWGGPKPVNATDDAAPSGMQRSLRYLLDANIDRQWRDWLGALAPALAEELGEAQAWRMLRRTGGAVAQGRALPACDTLGDLCG